MIKPGHLHMAARFSACMAAAGFHFSYVPLPFTLALTRRFGREDFLKRLHSMPRWAANCRKHILKIDLRMQGKENLPKPSRGHIYISNHQSYVDILVLMEALDTVAFLSKMMVLYLPFIGQCAYAGGTVFLNRGDKKSRAEALDKTLRMCRESTAVVVFPEGTRSADGGMREKIYPNAIRGAYEKGLKAIPVGLDGTWNVVPKTMDRVNLKQRVGVTVRPTVDPADYEDAEAFIDAVWGQVCAAHEESRARIDGKLLPKN